MQIRQTVLWPSPFDPKSTIDMALAKYTEERIRAIAVAANYCSVVGARYVVKRFAQRLNFAFHLTGIAVLLVSLLAFAA